MSGEEGSRTPFTWAPGKKPAAMQDWLLNVASDERVSCGALRTAVLLSFGFNAATEVAGRPNQRWRSW